MAKIEKPINNMQNIYINQKIEGRSRVNINSASLEELKTLPGINDKKALLIIQNRPYSSIYDLRKINGIGDDAVRKMENIAVCTEVK